MLSEHDAERWLSHWQSGPGSSPASSADYLYDGSGNRSEQVDASSGAASQVYYLFGGLEELLATSGGNSLTKYYSAGGLLIGVNAGGVISYLASDGLGSVSEALSTSGTVTAAQLYGPYGGGRYASGTMPTAKGFTGQRADAATSELDYYGARYYDPVLGQFASADTKEGPNRYGYVAGNPETLTDPTGHRGDCNDDSCGVPNSLPPPPPPPPPPNDSIAYWHELGQDNLRDQYLAKQWELGLKSGEWTDNGSDPAATDEAEDGQRLVDYFQMDVFRPVRTEVDKEHNHDYEIAQYYDPATGQAELDTWAELYTPKNDYVDNPKSPNGAGWVKGAKDKGDQAPIIVIDLRIADPNSQLTEAYLREQGKKIIYWPYANGPSHVARVIFIQPNGNITDVDPFHFGPPEGPNQAT